MAKEFKQGRGGERPGAGRKRKHRKTKRAVKVMLEKRFIKTLEAIAAEQSIAGASMTKGDLCEALVARWVELGAPPVEKLYCAPV